MSVYRLLFGTLRGRVSCSVFRPYSLFPTPYSLLPALCLLLLASCAPANGPIPHILDVQSSASEVPRYDRFELVVALEATYDNPYDVRDVELFAVFTGPDGREWPVPGFWDADDAWRVRFAPSAEGPWRYRLQVRDRSGESKPYDGQFTCLPSESHGWLQVGSWVEPAFSSRYLVYHDTWQGIYLDAIQATADRSGRMTILLPPFTRDIAVRLNR
jgi:ABC-type amino acid transport substrate-binding protein